MIKVSFLDSIILHFAFLSYNLSLSLISRICMSGNMLKKLAQESLKTILFVVLFVFSFVNYSQAKMSAKDISKELLEEISGQNAQCSGDDRNATCIIKSAVINGIQLQDMQVTSQIDSKNANFILSGKVANFPPNLADMKDFAPKKVQCKANVSLRANINTRKINCLLNADSYNLKIDANADLQSNTFNGKDIGEVLTNQMMDDYKILIREITLDFEGARFGDKVFEYTKKSTPELTREQFNAQVNMYVTSVPLMAANEKSMTPETLSIISSAAVAVGSILTNKSKGINITLRPKSAQFIEMNKLKDAMDTNSKLGEIINIFDIKVIKR